MRLRLCCWLCTLCFQVVNAQDKEDRLAQYRLGGGDSIRISVFQNPNLTLETRVAEDGAITYPLIGRMAVGGTTIAEAERAIARALESGNFIQEPQVSILLLQTRSAQVSVLGLVNRAGRYPLDTVNLRVSEMIAIAGGVAIAGGDLAILTGERAGKPFRKEIDIARLFDEKGHAEDIAVAGGDVIYVERAPSVYVYGEVNRPGAYRFERGMTLRQALARGGGPTQRGSERNLKLHRRGANGEVQVMNEPEARCAGEAGGRAACRRESHLSEPRERATTQMNLRQYFFMFRVRWRLALGIMLATVAIAVPVILMLPKQYTASTSLGVDIKSPDAITTLLMPTNLASQEEIIRSARVVRAGDRDARLGRRPASARRAGRRAAAAGATRTGWRRGCCGACTVIPSRRGDNIITIQYRSFSPAEAAAVANAFAKHYAEAAIAMKVEPGRQYARWFGEQDKKLRAELEAAQARLSAFQRDKGIGVKDENLHAETERLASLAAQLTAVQSAGVDANSKLRTGGDALPEVMQNPVIQGLRGDILRLEAKLRDAGANLGAKHPQYRAMQAELGRAEGAPGSRDAPRGAQRLGDARAVRRQGEGAQGARSRRSAASCSRCAASATSSRCSSATWTRPSRPTTPPSGASRRPTSRARRRSRTCS